MPEEGRYPGYDVLAKRDTPSWNEQTRKVIDQRLAIANEPKFFSAREWDTLVAVCGRIVPQPRHRPPIPVAGLVDNKLHKNQGDGFRNAKLPPLREAWRIGLAALDAEAQQAEGLPFHKLSDAAKDVLLSRAQAGTLHHPAWRGLPPALFFGARLVKDIVRAYYAHPTAWNDIGYGGPASPRGYVRMGFDRRDSWEAVEVKNGDVETARRKNAHVR